MLRHGICRFLLIKWKRKPLIIFLNIIFNAVLCRELNSFISRHQWVYDPTRRLGIPRCTKDPARPDYKMLQMGSPPPQDWGQSAFEYKIRDWPNKEIILDKAKSGIFDWFINDNTDPRDDEATKAKILKPQLTREKFSRKAKQPPPTVVSGIDFFYNFFLKFNLIYY